MTAGPGRRSSWPAIAAAAVLVPALYALSTGPTVWYESRHGPLSRREHQAVDLVYAPIISLIGEFEWAQAAAEWYFQFWITERCANNVRFAESRDAVVNRT